MVQGGGVTIDYREKPKHEPIANEAGNGLKNLRGTVAMARTGEVNSATGQFFINHKDNAFLDHRDNTADGLRLLRVRPRRRGDGRRRRDRQPPDRLRRTLREGRAQGARHDHEGTVVETK